jgi:hypothetical protein
VSILSRDINTAEAFDWYVTKSFNGKPQATALRFVSVGNCAHGEFSKSTG